MLFPSISKLLLACLDGRKINILLIGLLVPPTFTSNLHPISCQRSSYYKYCYSNREQRGRSCCRKPFWPALPGAPALVKTIIVGVILAVASLSLAQFTRYSLGWAWSRSFNYWVKIMKSVDTLRTLVICIKAFLMRKCNKSTFKDRHIAAGIFSARVEETLFRNHKRSISLLPSFDPLEELTRFWSIDKRPSDFEFLVTTLEQLGDLVREDVKLDTLYVSLASPGKQLSASTRTDPPCSRSRRDGAAHLPLPQAQST